MLYCYNIITSSSYVLFRGDRCTGFATASPLLGDCDPYGHWQTLSVRGDGCLVVGPRTLDCSATGPIFLLARHYDAALVTDLCMGTCAATLDTRFAHCSWFGWDAFHRCVLRRLLTRWFVDASSAIEYQGSFDVWSIRCVLIGRSWLLTSFSVFRICATLCTYPSASCVWRHSHP